MDFGDAHVITLQEAPEDFGEETALHRADTSDDAEIDQCDAAFRSQDGVAFVHVGMKDAVLDGAGEKALRDIVGEFHTVEARTVKHAGRGKRCTLDPGDRQDTFSGPLPVDFRDVEKTGLRVDGAHLVGAAGFKTQVELAQHEVGDRVGEGDRLQAAAFSRDAFNGARRAAHGGEFKCHLAFDPGTEDLYRAVTVRQRHLVDLRKGGGGNGFRKAREKPDGFGPGEFGGERRAGEFHREGRQSVLEATEIARDFRAEHVRPCREELSELDIGRAETFERRRETLAGAAFGAAEKAQHPAGDPRRHRQTRLISTREHDIMLRERRPRAHQTPIVAERAHLGIVRDDGTKHQARTLNTRN